MKHVLYILKVLEDFIKYFYRYLTKHVKSKVCNPFSHVVYTHAYICIIQGGSNIRRQNKRNDNVCQGKEFLL